MPIYEFQCDDCRKPFDKLVRSSAAAADVVCPGCGSAHVTKKMSVFSAKAAGGLSFSTSTPASSCSTGGT